jgi:uncharacterized protein YjdB
VSIDPVGAIIPLGTAQQFSAVGHFSNGNSKLTDVTWTSSDPSIASISGDGQARGLNQGTTTITAAASGQDAISPAPLSVGLAMIVVNPPQAGVTFPGSAQGGSNIQQFTALGTFADGSTRDVTASVLWTSDNPAQAKISNFFGSQGRATGVSQGTTTITARTTNTTGVVIKGAAKLVVG